MITTDFYHLLISNCVLAAVLLGLFFYASRVSRGVRGITTWGIAHFVYSLGAAMLDGTASEFSLSQNPALSRTLAGIGGMLACTGLMGLVCALIQFVGQRALTVYERGLMPLAALAALLPLLLNGNRHDLGAIMSAMEILALCLMGWQLRRLCNRPDLVPARLMMLACLMLMVFYWRDLMHALSGHYGPDPSWINVDLLIWFMLNFCMLMLASFRAAETLRQNALLDPLTGALNRRGLDSKLHFHGSSTDAEDGLAVIALDLDHFKTVNDHHGHQTGDQVLQRFSDVVRGCIRNNDLFVRLGGEEFILVLPSVTPEIAYRLAERIRLQVMALEFSGLTCPVTVSLGIAHTCRRNAPLAEMMRLADEALYAAKRNGRNRIELKPYPMSAMA